MAAGRFGRLTGGHRCQVGCLGVDSSRGHDEQLARLADINKALVAVIREKDKLLAQKDVQLAALRLPRGTPASTASGSLAEPQQH